MSDEMCGGFVVQVHNKCYEILCPDTFFRKWITFLEEPPHQLREGDLLWWFQGRTSVSRTGVFTGLNFGKCMPCENPLEK